MKRVHISPLSIAVLGLVFVMSLALGASAATEPESARTEAGTAQEGKSDHEKDGDHEHKEGQQAHEEEHLVRLNAEQLKQSGIRIETAGPGKLLTLLQLPGEVKVNADRIAHVVPRVAGMAREVRKVLGDTVKAGEVLAVIDSRELADTKATYLAARERVALAQANFTREEALWKQKISAEQDYLQARQSLAEARIEQRAAEQKLLALGLPPQELMRLARSPSESLNRYEITAPFAGTIIDKHISLGEALEDNTTIFVVADLSTVWVDLSVYPRDLPLVKVGEAVVVTAAASGLEAKGRIGYVQPVVSEETRRTFARVVLDNASRQWQPGLFVTGRVVTGEVEVPLLVSRSVLQTLDNNPVVFVQTEDGFEPRPVRIGRSNESQVEIIEGLKSGEHYVASGSFILKAELGKGEAAHEH
jgi:RND family efflux transporter, MFP subunit